VFEIKELTYVHIPKTGGQFVGLVLMDIYLSYRAIGYHTRLQEYEPSNDIISCIRNPFDWYVSIYFFYLKKDHPLTRGIEGFENTLRVLLDLKGSGRPIQVRTNNIDESRITKEDNSKLEFPPWTNATNYPSNRGYYSFMLARLTGLRNDIEYMRFENLTEDLVSILKDKAGLTSSQESLIRSTPHINTTEHDHYRTYYSDELIELVYEKDKIIFDRFGYEF